MTKLNAIILWWKPTNLALFKVWYAGVSVYGDIIGCKDFGMDCSAFSIRLIGMLDDVNLYRKLSTTYSMAN